MRSLVCVFVLAMTTIAMHADATAIAFTPNRFTLTVSPVGQPISICDNCADADPLNDFHLNVVLGGTSGGFPPNNQVMAGQGQLNVSGPYPSIGGNLPLAFLASLDLWDSNFPGDHSITDGTIFGTVFYGPSGGTLMCCSGSLNSAHVSTPQGFYSFGSFPLVQFVLTLDRPTDPVFTPTEAPEPISLVLLGTGLLAGMRTRRKG
jgi:hypothetical protein